MIWHKTKFIITYFEEKMIEIIMDDNYKAQRFLNVI